MKLYTHMNTISKVTNRKIKYITPMVKMYKNYSYIYVLSLDVLRIK